MTTKTKLRIASRLLPALAALAVAAAVPAQAQVFTPTYMTPYPQNEIGIYASDGPGDLALEGVWRRVAAGGADIGIRAGFADVEKGALLLGLEVRNPVILAGSPIGLAFTAGAQAAVGDQVGFGGQAGFTAGHAIEGGNVRFTPYIHPRLVVVNELSAVRETDLELQVRADVGADVAMEGGFSFRFAVNLGQGARFGAGVAFRQ
jgi:hypothetical protein